MNPTEYSPSAEDMSSNKISPVTQTDLESARPTIVAFQEKQIEPKGLEMCSIACFIGITVTFLLGLIGASVTYYVFCIMALIEDSHKSIQETCSDSNLWPFILTVLIINLGVAQNSSKGKDGPNPVSVVVSILVLVSLCTWGSIEFWNDCVQEKLSDTLLFTMVEITVYMEYCFIFLLLVLFGYVINKALRKE